MRRKKQVTLRDVASALGLTVHTVSKALRGLPGMSEDTRRDVFETARKLGYRTKDQEIALGYEGIPHHVAKRRRFTMLMTEATPFYRLQLQGVQDRLSELGHTVVASLIPGAIRAEDGFKRWIEDADLMYADGIFIPPALPDYMEKLLIELPLPKVLINFPPPLAAVDSVIWDVAQAIHQSVNHFVAMGHRRILYVGDIDTHRGFRLRWQTFRDAMRALGTDPDPRSHVTGRPVDADRWMADLRDKLSEGRFSAILCAVEQDLAKIFYVAHSLGLSVPRDLSLISLETMEHPTFPGLTRPFLLIRETGRRAAERLLWRIANPDRPYEHIRLQGHFLAGDTVIGIARGKA